MRRAITSILISLVMTPAGTHAQEKQRPPILDTHVHFFDPLRPTAPPKPKDGKPLPRPVLPVDLKRLASPHGVVGVLIVEASPILEDNQWWLNLAAEDPFIVGVIGRLDPGSEDFEKNLRRFAKNPLYRGIRISHNELKAELKGNLADRLKVMIDLNLALDVNGGPDMPADVAILASKLPKLRIVINHAANLRIDGKTPPVKWREGMEAAAKQPNVFCKVSALVEQTGQKQAPRDVKYYRPVLDTLWELFGEDRLIFGSNWPVSNGGAPYETVVGIVQDYFIAKGEKTASKFFLGNSRSAYAWRPRGTKEIKNSRHKMIDIPSGTRLQSVNSRPMHSDCDMHGNVWEWCEVKHIRLALQKEKQAFSAGPVGLNVATQNAADPRLASAAIHRTTVEITWDPRSSSARLCWATKSQT